MLLSRFFGRRNFPANSTAIRRAQPRRQPLVEALEGRQLLSGIVGNHIGVQAAIQGNHIGVPAAIQGNHIGVTADGIVGNHIG